MIKRNGMLGFSLKNQQPLFSVGRPFSVIKNSCVKRESAYRATSVGKLERNYHLLPQKCAWQWLMIQALSSYTKRALMGTITAPIFCQSKPAKRKILGSYQDVRQHGRLFIPQA